MDTRQDCPELVRVLKKSLGQITPCNICGADLDSTKPEEAIEHLTDGHTQQQLDTHRAEQQKRNMATNWLADERRRKMGLHRQFMWTSEQARDARQLVAAGYGQED